VALRLEILLEAVDRLTGPLARATAGLTALAGRAAAVGRAGGAGRLAGDLGNVASRAGQAAVAIGALAARATAVAGAAGAVGAIMAGRSALQGAAAMERFRITLTQVEGSATAADRALAWVNDFATRTPYEVAEVTRAFVDIRNLGLDPTRGALQAAGDAAAIMGTRFDEAVTALSAALRGEMDPIERFGVFARTEGDNIVMRWEANGRRMRAVVDKNNREMLARIIQTAWAQKFGGGMAELARSWTGMLSNLSDHWSRFQQRVMNAGVFAFLRSRLSGLLAMLDRLAANGTLQRWADGIAASLLRAGLALENFLLGRERVLNMGDAGDGGGLAVAREGGAIAAVTAAFRSLSDAIDAVGRVLAPILPDVDAMEVAMGALAVVLGSSVLAAVAKLGIALGKLALVSLTTPVGWAILLAGAGLLVWQNWERIFPWLIEQWEALPGPVKTAIDIMTAPIRRLVDVVQLLAAGWNAAADGLQRLLNLLPRQRELPPAMGQRTMDDINRFLQGQDGGVTGSGAPSPFRLQSAPGGGGDLGGVLRIRIEDGRVTANGRMNDPRVRLDVDQGVLMGAA
jgi:hypothetical protein